MAIIRSRKNRSRWGVLFLVAFVLRAWIPAGFMPAAGQPFVLKICFGDMPHGVALHVHSQSPQGGHQHAAGEHDSYGFCPYGCAPAAGPLTQSLPFVAHTSGATPLVIAPATVLRAFRLARAHAARGPPTLA